MISVLQDWRELGECIETLQRDRLPLHTTPQKNWDHFILRRALAGLEPSASIADLGCGHGLTLEFLRRQGFENLLGIDLSIGWRLRAREALTMYRERRFTRPYRILRGSISESSIAESSISLALSISTIEHGVDIDRFLADWFRSLNPGRGCLSPPTIGATRSKSRIQFAPSACRGGYSIGNKSVACSTQRRGLASSRTKTQYRTAPARRWYGRDLPTRS